MVVRIDPLHFLAGHCKRRQNQVLSALYLRMFLIVLFIRAPSYVLSIISFRWYVFRLLVVLVKLSVLAK